MSVPSLVIVLTSTQLNTPPLFLRCVDGDCCLVAAWAQAPLWSSLQLPASGAADFDLLTSAESSSYSYTSSAHFNPPLSLSSSLLLGDADTLHMAGTGGRGGRGGQITLWPTAALSPLSHLQQAHADCWVQTYCVATVVACVNALWFVDLHVQRECMLHNSLSLNFKAEINTQIWQLL